MGGNSSTPRPQIVPEFNSYIPMPRELDINGDIESNFKVFEMNWRVYCESSKLYEQPSKLQTSICVNAIGNAAVQLYLQKYGTISFNTSSPAILLGTIRREVLPLVVKERREERLKKQEQQNLQNSELMMLCPPPYPINVRSGEISENVRLFQIQWLMYLNGTELRKKAEPIKIQIMKNAMGADALKYYVKFESRLSSSEQVKATLLLDAIVRELPKVVFIARKHYNRAMFHDAKQMETESFPEFYSRISHLIQYCNYGSMEDDFLLDKIVCSSNTKLRDTLLKSEGLTLQHAIDKGVEIDKYREFTDMLKKQDVSKNEGKQSKPSHNSYDIKSKTEQSKKKCSCSNANCSLNDNHIDKSALCYNCGMESMRFEHENDTSLCPAYGKICKFCKGKHHFENLCMKKKNPRNDHKFCYKCGINDKRFDHEKDPSSCSAYGKTCDFCKGLHHIERFCMKKKRTRYEQRSLINLNNLDSVSCNGDYESDTTSNYDTKLQPNRNNKQNYNYRTVCYPCGISDKRYEHENDPSSCPAYGQICDYCNDKNHFQRFCMKKKKARDERNLKQRASLLSLNNLDNMSCNSEVIYKRFFEDDD